MTGSKRHIGRLALAGAAIAGTAVAAPPATKQVVTGPVATYWMSAQTTSGMAMGGMGGGKPSMASMLAMANGGGNDNKSLVLQLGSTRRPTGEPAAEHLPPSVLQAGATLPLLTPKAQPRTVTREEPGVPDSYEKPRGRMLIFWGCGERARAGQPYVIDFAKLSSGQVPAAYGQMMKGLNIAPMEPPSPQRHATYGEWPNERTRTQVPSEGSLLGQHTIKGNYSPQIQFAIGQGQDFLPAVQMTTNSQNPTGSFQLGWQPVAGATGYIASTMGGDGETMVMWTSAEVQSMVFALPDYLRPSDVSRLLANKTLMAPSQTSCTVPKEVIDAAPQSMYQFTAYGGEANFSYPARPADPKQAWNIEWTVKVRYRSATGGILGMESPYGDSGDSGARPSSSRPGKKPKKPGAMDILRGLGAPIPGGF